MRHLVFVLTTLIWSSAFAAELLLEAEGFADHGGWVLDPQFLDAMGSPYLLAHGLGMPIANAVTEVEFSETGSYRLWVRTKDWAPSHHPGCFKVIVDGSELPATFGNQGHGWIWQDGGTVEIMRKRVKVELADLTAFDGRCDALFFTTDMECVPPPDPDEKMAAWRRQLLGLPESPSSAGEFDVVVVGGGIAGCSAALTAARLGLQVAFIQNRPVLGGNASTEIGITVRGQNRSIVTEVAGSDREKVIRAEKNIHLYLGWHAFRAQAQDNHIESIDARDTSTNTERRFAAPVFVDCTGTGSVGFLAGADYRMGREAKSEFNESLAPETADSLHHGNTVVFATRMADRPVSFPDVPWATAVSKDYADLGGQVTHDHDNEGGLTHFWEYGQHLDPFQDAEAIRDHLFRAIYGTFSTAKRLNPETYAHLELVRVGHVPAGGESRRLMGDYILTENDVRSGKVFSDAVALCSGHFCLHYPGDQYDFRLGDWKFVAVPLFTVPFRCLYSKNIDNLLMAGKHISVTHVAGSATKTMLNGGQTGVATGAAAFLCKKHTTTPRTVQQAHIRELQTILLEQGQYRDSLSKRERANRN
ncbi:MAG: FAD-dependent oxidoreductase [Pirellulaceae bacterium]